MYEDQTGAEEVREKWTSACSGTIGCDPPAASVAPKAMKLIDTIARIANFILNADVVARST